ncbi:tape measure protein [Mucilaginibacter sp. Mucisp84]|uniref:tape measure protein n=1 Tax=Mucilaginibacter sp. Mucisp84 TaxID=3243058 RepID=UPI0039A740A2
MANLVDFLVRIKDMATNPLQRIASAGESSFRRLENGINRVTGRMGGLKMSIQDIDRKLADLQRTREISLDGRQIRQINREISQLEARRDRLTNTSRGGNGMGGFFRNALAIAGIGSITALGGTFLKAGMERQMNETTFSVLAGQKNGGKLSNGLLKFASDTIYGDEVYGEAKTMLGFGIAAKNIMPAMNMIGNVAMGNSEKMQSLTLAFSQTYAAGKLMGQDLLQYINAGFNPLQEISKKTGKSIGELKTQMEKGKISFQDVVGAFQSATGEGGRFHNMMQKLQETPAGKWQAFTGALSTLAGTIGVALLPVLGLFTDIMNGLLNNSSLMYGLAAAIIALAVGWGIYAIATNTAAIAQALLNFAMFLPVVLIALIIGLVVMVAKRWDGWGKSIKALWEIIKSFCSIVGVTFKEFFQQLVFGFEYVWLKAKSTFQFIAALIGNTIQAMNLALNGQFGAAKKVLTAHITTDADKELDKLKAERKSQQAENVKSVVGSVKNIIQQSKNVGLTRSKDSSGKSPVDAFTNGKFDTSGSGGSPSSSSGTNSAITGGGVRHITINVAKFQDKTEIHTSTFRESVTEMEDYLKEMFLRITNSAASTVS